jgi:hypothetical protein
VDADSTRHASVPRLLVAARRSALLVLVACDCGPVIGEPQADAEDVTGSPEPTTSGREASDATGVSTMQDSESDGDGICLDELRWWTPERMNFVFVVDTSLGMQGLWDHDSDPRTPDDVPRWERVGPLIAEILATQSPPTFSGIALAPGPLASNAAGEAQCMTSPAIDVPLALDNEAAVLAALPHVDALAGARALSGPMMHAIDALSPMEGYRSIVLITHGAPTCDPEVSGDARPETYDPAVLELVHDARVEHDIRTFVLALDVFEGVHPEAVDTEPDGIGPMQVLEAIAAAGGGFDVFDAADPEVAWFFEPLGMPGWSCVVTLDFVDVDLALVQLEIDGMPLPFRVECDENDDGFDWLEVDPTPHAELCPATCKYVGQRMKQAFDVELRVWASCPR